MARRGEKKISSLSWESAGGQILALSAGTAAVLIRAELAGIGGAVHETLLRTRGWLSAWVDGPTAPAALARISVGLRLAAGGSGTTVTVSPFSDGGYPWFFYETFVIGYEEMVTDVI